VSPPAQAATGQVGTFAGKRLGQSDAVAHLCPFLQERYRQDCNLAVQLLKCNKSHFRNHKFADVSSSPAEAGKKGSRSPPASCFLQLSLQHCQALILQPQIEVGEVLFPLLLRRQHRASASSSFTPASFHSSARSCYKKHKNLEFDSLLGA